MKGRVEEGKSCSPNAAIWISMCWDLPRSCTFKQFLHTYLHITMEEKFLRNWFLNYGGFFFPVWIWLLNIRSCNAWSLKGKIDCFCRLSQFHIYGGISLYYSCWRPTCLHCSESTLQDSAPTVSHWETLPKAGKRQQAKSNIHSQLMNAEIKTNKKNTLETISRKATESYDKE